VVNLASLAAQRHSVAHEMAQRAKRSSRSIEPVPAEDVRTGLWHLIELAAAYEGRGVDVGGSVDESDARTLNEVTRLLLKHREEQRARQRDAVQAQQLRVLEKQYRTVRNDGTVIPQEIQDRIVGALYGLDVQLSEADLDELVILPGNVETRKSKGDPRRLRPPDPAELTIKGGGGPADAARKTLAKILGRSPRTLATVKKRAGALTLARVAFGRWVTDAAREAYIAECRDCRQEAAKPSARSVRSLGEIDEASGRGLDSMMESQVLDFLTEKVFLPALLPNLTAPDARLVVLDVLGEKFQSSCELVERLVNSEPDVLEAALRGETEGIRDGLRNLVVARRAPDEAAVLRAKIDLMRALRQELLQAARDRFMAALVDNAAPSYS
jgi:hypothetical protein